MTIQALSQSLAYCAWFLEGDAKQGTFEIDTLTHVEPPAPTSPPEAEG